VHGLLENIFESVGFNLKLLEVWGNLKQTQNCEGEV